MMMSLMGIVVEDIGELEATKDLLHLSLDLSSCHSDLIHWTMTIILRKNQDNNSA